MTDIITITEADLARLQSWEFEEVWRAVGYVFRRRAEASKTLSAVPPAIEPAPVPPAPDDAPKSEPGEFTCPDCGQVFSRAQGLASHRSKRHGVKGQDVHAMQAGALGQHRKFRHAAPTVPPPPRAAPRTCEICGYQAPGPSTLEVHQRTCRVKVPETSRAETFVLEPRPPAEPGPTAHVHRYKLGSPAGNSVEGLCECGHRKLHPADLNGDISRNGKRSPNPKCPQCGKHALRDRHGYWCNGCQLEVKAS